MKHPGALLVFALPFVASLQVASAQPRPPVAPSRQPAADVVRTLAASFQREGDARAGDARTRFRPVASAATRAAAALAKDSRSQIFERELAAARSRGGDQAFEAKLRELGPQILALRKDMARAAGLTQADAQAIGTALPPLTTIIPRILPPAPGSVLGTLVITSFPDPQGFKSQCTNDSDTWHFDGAGAHAYSETDIGNTDCGWLWVGRGAVIQAPPNATRMTVSFVGSVDLNVWAVAWGFYAHAWAGFSLALTSTDGGAMWSELLGGSVIQVPVQRVQLAEADARNYFISPVLADHGNWKRTLADGDPDATASFDLPVNRTSNSFEIRPIVQVESDSVATGNSSAAADISTTSVKVTFYR